LTDVESKPVNVVLKFLKNLIFTMRKVIIIDIISPKLSKKEAKERMIESENLVNTY